MTLADAATSCPSGMYLSAETNACLLCPYDCMPNPTRYWFWGLVSGVTLTGGALALAMFLRRREGR